MIGLVYDMDDDEMDFNYVRVNYFRELCVLVNVFRFLFFFRVGLFVYFRDGRLLFLDYLEGFYVKVNKLYYLLVLVDR